MDFTTPEPYPPHPYELTVILKHWFIICIVPHEKGGRSWNIEENLVFLKIIKPTMKAFTSLFSYPVFILLTGVDPEIG